METETVRVWVPDRRWPYTVTPTRAQALSSMTRVVLLLGLWMTALLAGCATPRTEPAGASLAADCAVLLGAVDAAVVRSGVGDAQAARIAGFPALRVDRWLASYRTRLKEPGDYAAWIERLRSLDAAARRAELANLPAVEQHRLAGDLAGTPALESRVQECGDRLAAQIARDPDARAALARATTVPDEYRTVWRVLGLYPLTAIFAGHGIADYHAKTHAAFGRPLEALRRQGVLMRYRPPDTRTLGAAEIEGQLTGASHDILGIPEPAPAELARLFAQFAPVFEIDVGSEDDRPGAPRWTTDRRPQVDTRDPVVYRLASYTRHDGETLLQLNYVVWFPARPPAGRFDILSGHLDGLTWRVTLARDGRPLLYDAMHNCGCYHMFFPTAAVALHPDVDRGALEPPLVPQQAPALAAGERLVIRLAHRTHHIERIYATRERDGTVYRLADYDALRSLVRPDGSRQSLFAADGLVPGTARRERWLFWPLGIPAPGAMRQWGHHATAFVGRRHFDDADLLERLFVPIPSLAR